LARLVRSAIHGNDLVILVDEQRRINTGLKQRHSPERVARARVDAYHTAVARGRKENTPAPEKSQVRMRIRIVPRTISWIGCPNDFARLFLESIKAIRRGPLRAPVSGDATRDDQIAVDDR